MTTMLILTLALLSSSAFSQSTFTLEQAKQYALENHLSIQNAQLETKKAIYKKRETIGIGLPQVDMQGSYNYFINLPRQAIDGAFFGQPGQLVTFEAGTKYNASGNLNVGQLIFNGSYIVGLQVSKLFVDFQRTFEIQTQEDVVFNVIKAYSLYAVAQDNLVFIDSLVQLTSKLADQQMKFQELGLSSKEAVDQMLFTVKQAENGLRQAKLQRDNAAVMLKLAMNFPIETEVMFTDDSEKLMSESNISLSGNVMNNVQVQILQQSVMLNEYNLKNYKYERLPSLNSFFQQGYNAFRNEFDFFGDQPYFQQSMIGLQLNIPIFSGGQGHYKIKQAQVEVLKSTNELKMLQQGLKAQEKQFLNNLIGAKDQYELQKENLELARRIYTNAVKKKEIGSGSELEVTQKYNQFIAAQTELMSAKINVLDAKLAIEKLYNKILKSNN